MGASAHAMHLHAIPFSTASRSLSHAISDDRDRLLGAGALPSDAE
jgi:hypothetical protein